MIRSLRTPFSSLLALAIAACGGGNPPAPSSGAVATPGQTVLSSPGASPRPTPIPLATATPLGARLVATIAVPLAPCAMAVDASSVWITGSSTAELVRVDPSTNAVAGRVALEGSPCGVAAGPDGRIWVALLGAGAIVAVDPATLKVTGRIDDVGRQLWDLKAGLGAIWVVDRSAHAVLRIDPVRSSISATIAVGPQASGLAVLPGAVWVSDDTDGMLRRIDPATNKVVTTVAAGGAPSWFADDGLANVVVAERGAGKVLTVSPITGALGEPLDGWNEPLDGTVVGGSAWIPEGGGRRVGVVDLASTGGAVIRYDLPGAVNPFVAEPGFGDVWVLDFGDTTIWRIRP